MSIVGLVARIAGVDWAGADQAAVAGVLADVGTVRGWLDSIEILAARRLTELAAECPSMFPEQVAAQAGRVTLNEASKGFNAPTPPQPSLNSVPPWPPGRRRAVMSMCSPGPCDR